MRLRSPLLYFRKFENTRGVKVTVEFQPFFDDFTQNKRRVERNLQKIWFRDSLYRSQFLKLIATGLTNHRPYLQPPQLSSLIVDFTHISYRRFHQQTFTLTADIIIRWPSWQPHYPLTSPVTTLTDDLAGDLTYRRTRQRFIFPTTSLEIREK